MDSTPERVVFQIVSDRFWSRVDKSGDCWLWTGSLHDWGYGQFLLVDKRFYAHRLAWALFHGAIPPGIMVCHRCDVPRCVRPDHLFLGTPKQNSEDMVRKGRGRPGMVGKKLDQERASEIRCRYAAGGVSQAELAREFGVSGNTVWRIVRGYIWKG